jgi:hypothetical protein
MRCGVVRAWRWSIVVLATIVACEFPHPARNGGGGGGDGGNGDGSGSGSGDGSSSDGASAHGLSTFATVNGVALNQGRSFFATALVNNRLTVLGGVTDTILASVEQAPVMAGDTLGSFALGPALHDGVSGAVAVALPSTLFVLGGADSSLNAITEDQCTSINANGTLNTFITTTCPALGTPRQVGGVVVTSGFVFAIAGNNNNPQSTDLTGIEAAALSGVPLGPFQSVNAHLLTARSQFATVVANNHVYVIGGTQGSDTIEVSTINGSGALGSFVDAGVHLVTPRLSHAAVALNGTLYVIGGRNSNLNSLDSVEAAPIHADGSLGPFATVANVKLQTARYGHAAQVIGSSIYVFGGQSDVALDLTSVERAIFR